MSIFSKNLRFLRKSGKHNQENISRLFNKRPNTVGNWENGKSEPSLTELMKLAEFFNVRADDLLYKQLELPAPGQAYAHTPKTDSDKLATPSESSLPGNEFAGSQFQALINEIRMLHDKVDLLASKLESTGIKRNSDKSFY